MYVLMTQNMNSTTNSQGHFICIPQKLFTQNICSLQSPPSNLMWVLLILSQSFIANRFHYCTVLDLLKCTHTHFRTQICITQLRPHICKIFSTSCKPQNLPGTQNSINKSNAEETMSKVMVLFPSYEMNSQKSLL